MAKYKFANNGLISGRLGASTFQRNGIEKNFVDPTNTFSVYKQFQIDSLTFYSQQWQLLSQDEMILWHQYSFNRTDSFAADYSFNGAQSFISINSNFALFFNDNTIVYASEPIISNSKPLLIHHPYTTITAGTYTIHNGITGTPFYVAVYSTFNLSAGVFKPRNNDFRFLGFANLNSGVVGIYPLFNSRFGANPSAGSKIFTRLWQFNTTTGVYSYKFQMSTIVS